MPELNDSLRIAKNTLFLNVSTVLIRGLSFITSIVLARYLDKEGFGRYTFAINFTALFVVMSELGLSYLTVREVAKDRASASKYLGHNIIIRAALAAITFIFIVLTVNIIHYPPVVKLIIYILAFYTIGKSFAGSFESIFFAFERMGFISFLNIFLTFLILCGILVGIGLKYDLARLLLAYPAATAIYICLAYFLITKKIIKSNFKFDFIFAKNLIKDSIPFVLSGIFMSISSKIDTVMLRNMQGDIATGYYGVSRTFVSILVFIPANFITVLYPVFSRFYKLSQESLVKYFERSTQLLLILALPIAVGGMILAGRLVLLFYGGQYLPAAVSLKILVWALAIQITGSCWDILMLVSNRQATVARVTFWLMVFNITLNYVMISKLSYIGASLATLITNLFSFVVFFIIVSRNVYRLNLLKLSFKPILATFLMGIFVYLLRDKNLVLIICSSCFIYILMLALLKLIKREDIILLKQLFRINQPSMN